MAVAVLVIWLMFGFLGLYVLAEKYGVTMSYAINAYKEDIRGTAFMILLGPFMLILSHSPLVNMMIENWKRYMEKIIKEEIDPYLSDEWLEKQFQMLEAEVAQRKVINDPI